jgi:hypothetical protein
MNKRRRIAQVLVGLGSLNVVVGATLHLVAGYPIASAALAASNLSALMLGAMRAVFLMIGWTWIMIAALTLIAAFTETRIRKTIVLFCGLGLLAQIPEWVRLMGWFIGNEMFLAAAALIVCGGLLLPPPAPAR